MSHCKIVICAALLLLFAHGCDDSGGDQGDVAMDTDSIDVTDTTDSIDADANPGDMTDTQDMGDADMGDADAADADMTTTCNWTPPSYGVGAIVDAPGECGLDFQWISPENLGEPVEQGSTTDYTAVLLGALVEASGFETPTSPIYDVGIRQFTYKTQDRGQEVEASAVIAWPSNYDGSEAIPVMAWLHGTSGFTDLCAPSNNMNEWALPALFASLGYIVVAPDYIGLKGLGAPTGFKHPYLVGQPTAIASLDAIRAASRMAPELDGLCASPRTLIAGASQGGHAALWVDRYAPYYAPDIELIGVVATVAPSDWVGQTQRALTQFVEATGNISAFFGAAADWYGLEGRLNEMFLSPYDVDIPAALGSTCDFGDLLNGVVGLDDVFQPAFLADVTTNGIDNVGPWDCMTNVNGLTTTTIPRIEPTAPEFAMLMLWGEADDLVSTPVALGGYDTLCGQGMDIEYLECLGAGHVPATLWALPEVLTFMEARFNGDLPEAGAQCDRTAGPVTCSATPAP